MLLDERDDYIEVLARNVIVKTIISGVLLAGLLFLGIIIVLSVLTIGSGLNERILVALVSSFIPIMAFSIIYAPRQARKVRQYAGLFADIVEKIVENLGIDRSRVELIEITPTPLIAAFRYKGVYVILLKYSLEGERVYVIVADPVHREEYEGYSPTYNIRIVEEFLPIKRGGYDITRAKAHVLLPEPGEDKVVYMEAHISTAISKGEPDEIARLIEIIVPTVKEIPQSSPE